MHKLFKNALKNKKLINYNRKFDYKTYWQERYCTDGNSGAGSYGVLAEYKAEVIIEFGCGDGSQLKLMNYKKYIGSDVARSAIDICCSIFKNDGSKSFYSYEKRR